MINLHPIEHVTITYRDFPALARLRWPKLFTLSVCGPAQDHIFEAIKASRSFYERDLLEQISLRVPDSPGTVIDVGANIGNHSLFFSRILHKYVVSIEPQIEATNLLARNMQINLVSDRNEILRLGVGEHPGIATIIRDAETAPISLGAARLSHNQSIPDAETVQVSTIDTLCLNRPELPPVQLIKIDTEGMETQVLRGAIATIAKYRPLIVAEATNANAFNDIVSILLPRGYTVSGPFAWTPTYIFSPTPLGGFQKLVWRALACIRLARRLPFAK